MSQPVTIETIYRGATPRADRSFKLSFDTQELSSEELAALHQMHLTTCWLTVSPDENAVVDAPAAYQKTNPARSKSPSKVLRQELWAYFQEAKLEGAFDSFYEQTIDVLVRHWHDRRMAL